MPIISSQLGKKVIVRSTANDVVQLAQTAVQYGSAYTFNPNTSVDSTNDFITLSSNTVPHPFRNDDPVLYYTDTGNTALTGLTNNTIYYVVSANSVGVKLAATKGAANINITATITSETGHNLRLTEDVLGFSIAKVLWSVPDPGTGASYANVARTNTVLRLAASGSMELSSAGIVIDTGEQTANLNVTFVGNQNAVCICELHKQSNHRGDSVR